METPCGYPRSTNPFRDKNSFSRHRQVPTLWAWTCHPLSSVPGSASWSQDEQRPTSHFSWHQTPLPQAFQGALALLLWANPSFPASVNPAHHISAVNWGTKPHRLNTGWGQPLSPTLSVLLRWGHECSFKEEPVTFRRALWPLRLLPCDEICQAEITGKNNQWFFLWDSKSFTYRKSRKSKQKQQENQFAVCLCSTDTILNHELPPPTVGRTERTASYTRTYARRTASRNLIQLRIRRWRGFRCVTIQPLKLH